VRKWGKARLQWEKCIKKHISDAEDAEGVHIMFRKRDARSVVSQIQE